MHGRGAHQCVHDLVGVDHLLVVCALLEARPKESLQLCEAPELDHFLAQEVGQQVDSVVLKTPEEEHSAIEEGVRLDLARIVGGLSQVDQRLDADLFQRDILDLLQQKRDLVVLSYVLGKEVVQR